MNLVVYPEIPVFLLLLFNSTIVSWPCGELIHPDVDAPRRRPHTCRTRQRPTIRHRVDVWTHMRKAARGLVARIRTTCDRYPMTVDNGRRIRRAAADQPVRSVDDDLLGRGPFAAALAGAIAGWREPESLVVALTGPWGTGKSTIKNFVIEALRAMPNDERPDLLSFTPWDVAGSGTAGDRLLREIATALNHPDASAADRARAAKWEEWAAALNLTAAVPAATPRIAAGAVFVAGLAAVGASALLHAPAFELTIQIVGIVATAIGGVLAASATLAQRAATFFSARSKRRERTLETLKGELRDAMADRERQLIVIVDEIDRVPASEMQLLLRAIRANADFPQVVFLLVFERAVVEKAIADQAHVDGGEYLKKIIQIPFSIPLTESRRVQKVLFRQLDETLDDLPGNVPFDQRRWGNLFFGGVNQYIKTLRDVYRYVTTVEFHAGVFRATGTMEVNQIDLLGLEALRVFEPAVYDALPEHRRLLLEGPGRSHRDKQDDAQAEFARLLERAPEKNREAVKQILAVVFQPIEWLVQNYRFGSGFEEGWERELRACSERYFDRYFLLALPEGDVSQRDVEVVLAAASDASCS
jgi:predicted KAP-like P-loop ATPase